MSKKLEIVGNYLKITDSDITRVWRISRSNVSWNISPDELFVHIRKEDDDWDVTYLVADCIDANDSPFTSSTITSFLDENTGLSIASNDNPGNVFISDQSTASIDLFFSEGLQAPTTLASNVLLFDTQIVVTDSTGFAIGDWIGIFSGAGKFYWGEVLNVVGSGIELDSPVNFAFSAGDNVVRTNKNMAVDGSVSARGFAIQTGSGGLVVDVTRIMWSMQTLDPPSTGEFGDQPRLTKGVVLRITNGDNVNLFNIKDNFELAELAETFTILQQVQQNDINAVGARTTWAGQENRGVVIRLEAGDELEILVQDDLSGLVKFTAVAQGHVRS